MPTDLVEVDEFTDPVTVPEAGDDRKAASIVPAFQALLNRTRNLKNLLTGAGAVDIEIASGTSIVMKGILGIQYDVLKTRTVPIPLDDSQAISTPGWLRGSVDPGVQPFPGGRTAASGAVERWNFKLPHGALVKHVRAAILNPSMSPGPITLDVWQRRNDQGAPYTGTSTKIGTATTSTGGTLLLDANCAALAVATDGTLDTYYVEMTCGANGQWIKHIELEFGDPGPRNF